jgi:hypothetical protein
MKHFLKDLGIIAVTLLSPLIFLGGLIFAIYKHLRDGD